MLKIVNMFFEENGNPAMLKCSTLEKYAQSMGFNIKAYDFRRCIEVRQRIDELTKSVSIYSAGSMAFKNMDIEKLKLTIKKYEPEILTYVGVAGIAVNAALAIRSKCKKRSNNWLKMHGYPMRRKLKQRRRKIPRFGRFFPRSLSASPCSVRDAA